MGNKKDRVYKAIGTGSYKTIVEAPIGATEKELRKKANKYIKGEFIISN